TKALHRESEKQCPFARESRIQAIGSAIGKGRQIDRFIRTVFNETTAWQRSRIAFASLSSRESRSFAARSPAKTRSKLNALSRPFLLRSGILPVRTEQLPYYRCARDPPASFAVHSSSRRLATIRDLVFHRSRWHERC